MCQITINPSFAGTSTNTGASVTVSGTVTMTPGDSGPCTQLQVSIVCLQNHTSSVNTTVPDSQGNWTITLPVTCTCNDKIEVNVKCLSPVTCQAATNGTIVCGGGSTGTGGTGTGGTETKHCRPKTSWFGFSIVIRCQLVLFIMSIGWGTALGLFIFYLGLGQWARSSVGFGNALLATWIIAAAVALVATVIYLMFCGRCLCWFWLLIWRVLWLGGILAAWFRKTSPCGPNCVITSWVGVGLMIAAIVALFVWKGDCKKTICDAAYEGLLYTVAVFFSIAVPLFLWGFPLCVVPLNNYTYGPPWGYIVLGSAFVLFGLLLFIGIKSQSCSVSSPPPEWDF